MRTWLAGTMASRSAGAFPTASGFRMMIPLLIVAALAVSGCSGQTTSSQGKEGDLKPSPARPSDMEKSSDKTPKPTDKEKGSDTSSKPSDKEKVVDEGPMVKAVEKLGGMVTRDDTQPGKPVISVDLRDAKLTDADLKGLKDLKHLRQLILSSTGVTDEGLKELKELKQLTELLLSDTKVTGAGLKELKELKQLRRLSLSQTKVTDAGMKEVKEFKAIVWLNLERTEVSDMGLKELHELKLLETLFIGKTKVTKDGIAAFEKVVPNCSVDK